MIECVTVVAWFPRFKGLQIAVFAEAHEAINFAIDKAGWFVSPAVVTCPVQYPNADKTDAR